MDSTTHQFTLHTSAQKRLTGFRYIAPAVAAHKSAKRFTLFLDIRSAMSGTMYPSRSLRPGQGSRARGSRRGRGAPSHNQTASRNHRNERDHQNLNTLLHPAYWWQPTTTIVQFNVHHHVRIEENSQVVQTHSRMGYWLGNEFVPTSSTITTTVSTESHIMDHGSSPGAYTPASEPPEPWPSHAGNDDFDNVGAQFADEGTPYLAARDRSGGYTGIQDECSPYPLVMVVANDGRAGGFDPAATSDLNNENEIGFDRAGIPPSDPSKAYLESFSDEAWLRPIPLRIRRASTFPLLGQHEEDVVENLVSLSVSINTL